MEPPKNHTERRRRGGLIGGELYRPGTSPRSLRRTHLLSQPLDEHGTPLHGRRATPRADARRRELAADRRA